MFSLGKCFTKRLFPKFCKHLLQAEEVFLQECLKGSPFAKKKVTFPCGEKEKKPLTHCFGKSFLLICSPASLPWTVVTRATLTTAWTAKTSNTMSKSLPFKCPAHFYSRAEPGKHYFAQQNPRNAETAEFATHVWRVFQAVAVTRISPLLVSLSRTRKEPILLPEDNSSRSASFLLRVLKYHLGERKGKIVV